MNQTKHKWVALLRGINVGGHNKVPMAELRALAEGLGWSDVRSYIASGNLVFVAGPGDHGRDLRDALSAELAIDVAIMVLSGPDVQRCAATCPFEDAGNRIHVAFCAEAPRLDAALRDRLIAEDERLVVDGHVAFLHAPSGAARSRLLARLEDVLGVACTVRNLNTLRKLAQMAD